MGLRLGILAFLLVAPVACAQTAPPFKGEAIPIATDGGGIGFDDLRFASRLHRIVVPAGRVGRVVLIDPATHCTTAIGALSTNKKFGGGHGEGTTSADEGGGVLFAIDRTSQQLVILDPGAGHVIARAPLAKSPDYVRYVESTNEAWVTEPDAEQIEIFRVSEGHDALRRDGVIAVPGGPESLIIDPAGHRAFTHLWSGTSVVVDINSRAIVNRWKNGCDGSRGIAYDSKSQLLFAGCAEGKAIVMDVAHGGTILSTRSAGSGVDIIDYDPVRRHLYLPGGKSATMTIFSVSANGQLTPLVTVATAGGAHCVTTDGKAAYVCDPNRGRVLVIPDTW